MPILRKGSRTSSCAAALLLLASSSCSRSPSAEATTTSALGAAPSGIARTDTLVLDAASPTAGYAGDARDQSRSAFAAGYLSALPAHGKSIGHTSVVFKLGLIGGLDAAYKPRSHRGGERFHGELAAFRLAVAWSLPNVPAAIPRSFPAEALRGALDEKSDPLYDAEVIAESDGTVRGALIPWIPKLEFLQLESGAPRAQWITWLDDIDAGAPSPAACDADLAAQISTMILFDTMSGNWDRWSGGNIGVTRGANGACDRVLFIDNDGAFFDPIPAAPAANQLALVKKMNRFSKSFVGSLRSVSEAALEKAIGDEAPGRPLLGRHVLDAFFARRKTVLIAIDQKIAANGEAATLSLP